MQTTGVRSSASTASKKFLECRHSSMIDPFTRIFQVVGINEFRDFDTQAEVAPVGPGTGENRVLHVCLVLCNV